MFIFDSKDGEHRRLFLVFTFFFRFLQRLQRLMILYPTNVITPTAPAMPMNMLPIAMLAAPKPPANPGTGTAWHFGVGKHKRNNDSNNIFMIFFCISLP